MQRHRQNERSVTNHCEWLAEPEVFDRFGITLDVVIRTCRREDLPVLEWFGQFTPDRGIMEDTFAAQARGESLMLVAEVNGVASGQVWIDLTRREVDSTGVIWAARVLPCLRNRGIGRRLLETAERILRDRQFARAELSVERSNVAALRLYERLGYTRVNTRPVRDGEVTFDPIAILVQGDQWLLRKNLGTREHAVSGTGGLRPRMTRARTDEA
ncbi:MAG TPA: N-acetyltransferase [Phycisphaerae bacterium]|nr:N-acetyltransferase [Phycisphaerae bacterium]HOJ75401.1 N-acetyltransferase [Phycisphaerae bacterium]HOM52641.1 N-acetyltransferase [Phycisphaerae bacterium]HON67590.1 N-acetyltransferase [Phycisphaerae bacterium]HPP27915.1 N-acetyltransferase [Phycisphaerae bacterium]